MVIFVILLASILVLWYFAPRDMGVHAAKGDWQKLERHRLPFATVYRTPEGKRASLVNRIPVWIKGTSAVRYGIDDGSRLMVKFHDDVSRGQITVGDLVVINSTSDGSVPSRKLDEQFWRMRKIKALAAAEAGETLMEFYPHSETGQEFKSKPLRDAVGLVEFRL